MAGGTFTATIAKVDETLFSGEVVSLTVPGAAGVMTILAHHEPLTSTLKSGTITVKTGQETKSFAIETGVLECSGNKVVVLL